MSEAAKMRHIEITIGQRHPRRFKVPADKARGVLVLLSDYEEMKEETFSSDEVFASLYAETSEPAATLRGFRGRDNMTQLDLAEKLGSSQSAVAGMEAAKRPISKAMAKKLGVIFNIDHRAFL